MAKEVKDVDVKGAGKRGPKPKPGTHVIDKSKCEVVHMFIPVKEYKELKAIADEKHSGDVATVIREIVYRSKKWPAIAKNN